MKSPFTPEGLGVVTVILLAILCPPVGLIALAAIVWGVKKGGEW